MKTHTTINAALVARRMLPADRNCTCHVCGEEGFYREDMATDAATVALFGVPVCTPCADDHAACECCGHVTAYSPVSGWFCADCVDDESPDFQRREAKAAGHFA